MSNEIRKVLPEGQYVLSQDVTNPSVDRRHKRSLEFMETWTAGMKFDVQVHTFNSGRATLYEAVEVKYNIIQCAEKYGRVSMSHDGFEALVAKLTPVNRSVESLAHAAGKGYLNTEDLFKTLVADYDWDLDKLENLVNTTADRVQKEN